MSGILQMLTGGKAPIPYGWPANIGDAYEGGFFAGQINVSGTKYNLVVAPKSTGETTGLAWGVNGVTTGITSRIDGPSNTASLVALGSAYQAAIFCNNLNNSGGLNGYTDWYLPAINELEVLYYYLKPGTNANNVGSGQNANAVYPPEPVNTGYTSGAPAQTSATGPNGFRTGEANAFNAYYYYSSSEGDTANRVWSLLYSSGGQYIYDTKTDLAFYVRAVRRVLA